MNDNKNILSVTILILVIIFESILLQVRISDLGNKLNDISQKLDELDSHQFTVIKEVPTEEMYFTETFIFSDPDIQTLFEKEIPYLAKTVYGEARGCDKTQQAAVVWCILNRVDDERFPNDIISVIIQKWQFAGYNENHPVEEEIEDLVIDVLTRWDREHDGETNVGRILPKEYVYFHGDGKINHFTTTSKGTNEWDWSWGSVY